MMKPLPIINELDNRLRPSRVNEYYSNTQINRDIRVSVWSSRREYWLRRKMREDMKARRQYLNGRGSV